MKHSSQITIQTLQFYTISSSLARDFILLIRWKYISVHPRRTIQNISKRRNEFSSRFKRNQALSPQLSEGINKGLNEGLEILLDYISRNHGLNDIALSGN